jgi:hypothetical protein
MWIWPIVLGDRPLFRVRPGSGLLSFARGHADQRPPRVLDVDAKPLRHPVPAAEPEGATESSGAA